MNISADTRFLPQQAASARRIFVGLEKLFSIFAIMYFTNGFFVRFLLEASMGSALSNLNLLIYFGSTGLFAVHCQGRRFTGAVFFGVAPFLVLSFASVLWSIDPSHSLRQAIGFFGISVFGLYLTTRFTFRTIINLLCWAFGSLLVGSFLLGAGAPSIGVEQGSLHRGAWIGGFTHKNELGMNSAFSVLLFALRARSATTPFRTWFFSGFTLLAFLLVLLTTSSTALVVSSSMLALILFLYYLRGRRLLFVAFSLFAIVGLSVAALVLISNLEQAADLLGKDLTLTGRTYLWSDSIEAWQERPLLGYGFDAFWLETSREANRIRARRFWDVPHSHNGAVDVLLDLGVTGLIFSVGLFVYLLLSALRFFQGSRSQVALWPLSILFYILMSNITESNFVKQKSFEWVLLIVMANFPYLKQLRGRVGVYVNDKS